MNTYESTEHARYEGFWTSLRGGFSTNQTHYSSQAMEPSVAEFLRRRLEQIPNPTARRSIRILDLGCGNGRNIIPWARAGFDAIGVDFSGKALAIARSWAPHEMKFVEASVLDLPLDAQSIDIAIDTGCFHHLRKSQWPRYFRELKRVLRPNGEFFLQCFSLASGDIPKFTPRGKRHWRLRHGHFSRYTTENELRATLAPRFHMTSIKEVQKQESPLRFFLVQATNFS